MRVTLFCVLLSLWTVSAEVSYVKPENLDICETCHNVVNTLRKMLADQRTREKIIEEIEKYCKMLPLWEAQCIELVETIGQEVDKLQKFLDPEMLCKKLKLCNDTSVPNTDFCPVCEKIMEKLKTWLESGILQDLIDEYITPVCNKLGQYEPECKQIIDEVEKIIKEKIDKFEPKHTCELMKLC
ncbi:hypothetical protein EG68_07072 [Paragonimus skrjabini miyazakii]|uniref:Saposin B-type domain-containing protein n=1 Tax=Paragonimus skrjabini miyazakii TaxID=59628 RepID=A0A8S9YLV0_9TREM|nr:hypothetical protein EG68_07072 [Paragonimus skrjabini miyazakii]